MDVAKVDSHAVDLEDGRTVRPGLWRRVWGGVKGKWDAVLRQKVEAEDLAYALTMGFTLGLFPIMGCGTLVVVAGSYTLKLNGAAALTSSFFATPFALLLIVPFFHIGQFILPMEPITASFTELASLLRTSIVAALSDFGTVLLVAAFGWAICLPFFSALLYFPLLFLVRFAFARFKRE